MHYESESWCLRENEMAILRKTQKAMMRAMCGVEMIEKKRSPKLTSLLGLKDTLEFGWTSQGEWSTMVWVCLEKGQW